MGIFKIKKLVELGYGSDCAGKIGRWRQRGKFEIEISKVMWLLIMTETLV
jgi:hypothetical protein